MKSENKSEHCRPKYALLKLVCFCYVTIYGRAIDLATKIVRVATELRNHLFLKKNYFFYFLFFTYTNTELP